MNTNPIPMAAYESQVKKFKPEHGMAAINSNDLRRFVYEWFTHFEHASPVDFYLSHLDDKDMYVAFPAATPITNHDGFAKWYANLLSQTLWNFHDVSAIQIKQTAPQEYLVTFIVNWYGEVKADSDQLPGWQSRKDSNLYHYTLRQTWTVKADDRIVIKKLAVTSGDTPSPISEGLKQRTAEFAKVGAVGAK